MKTVKMMLAAAVVAVSAVSMQANAASTLNSLDTRPGHNATQVMDLRSGHNDTQIMDLRSGHNNTVDWRHSEN